MHMCEDNTEDGGKMKITNQYDIWSPRGECQLALEAQVAAREGVKAATHVTWRAQLARAAQKQGKAFVM